MRMRFRHGWVLAASLAACGGDPGADASGPEPSGSSSTTVISTSTTTGTTTGPAGSTAPDAEDTTAGDEGPLLDVGDSGELPPGCAGSAALGMVLVDQEGDLYRFEPETLTLELLGPLVCPGAMAPMALTIDRSDQLWVLMIDGAGLRVINTVDPESLDCQPTDFVDPFSQGFIPFSLAFVADAPGAQEESLYLSGLSGMGVSPDAPGVLGVVDLVTMETAQIGTLALPNLPGYEIADLSGTGDARLFGLFATEPAHVTEIDPSDASLLLDLEVPLSTGSAWSFAQWAGRLWVFTATAPSGSSEVYSYDPDSQVEQLEVPDLGIRVVGAAVSTCAPYEPEG